MATGFADFDLTDRQRVDKRILHWTGTTRLFQIGMTIEKPCAPRRAAAGTCSPRPPAHAGSLLFRCHHHHLLTGIVRGGARRCRRFLRDGQDAVKVPRPHRDARTRTTPGATSGATHGACSTDFPRPRAPARTASSG